MARKGLTLQERDFTIGQKLNRGPLSTPLIKAYFPPTLRGVEMRLTDLNRAEYVYRPIRRFKSFVPDRKEPFVHANDDRMDEALLAQGIEREGKKLDANNYHHEHFLSSTVASIELAGLEKGWEFKWETDLLGRAPSGSREVPCHIEFLGQTRGEHGWENAPGQSDIALLPDAYFGFNKPEGARVYFLEVDCGHERVWSTDLNKKNWRATLLKYIYLIDNGRYKKHFGIDCAALALFVFNDRAVMEAVQKELLHITDGQGKNYMCFMSWTDFKDKTFIPKQPNKSFVANPWSRMGHDRNHTPHTPFYI